MVLSDACPAPSAWPWRAGESRSARLKRAQIEERTAVGLGREPGAGMPQRLNAGRRRARKAWEKRQALRAGAQPAA